MIKPQKELSTKIVVNKKNYLVITEDLGFDKHLIITTVYLGGEIISTEKAYYKNILKSSDLEKEIRTIMKRQHELSILNLKELKEDKRKEKSLSDYLDEIKTFLQKKQYKEAFKLLNIALDFYPDEPFFLSYYGCLESGFNKNYKDGIDACLKVIKLIKEKMPYGHEFYYPILYLNLGRSYLASGNKKYAFESFQRGLVFDNDNKDLLREIRKLGIRKRPILSFLPRSHLINKYIGKIFHRLIHS
ncbi:MAG: tetratricopeptide repeat protein [Thermodesulfovibrionales bacterium]